MAAAAHGPVMVIDDNEDMRELMQIILVAKGHSTVTAENGEDALQRLRAGLNPCVILLDLMMPVKDGFEFRREQLADPAIASIPVIVFSGHHDVQKFAAELQAVECVQKTMDLSMLADLALKYCGSTEGH